MVRRYDELTADLACTLEWASSHVPRRDGFVLGHSNGGQVALRLTLESPGSLRA